ncbi:MAG: hypothetical protein GF329_10980 [Candidatus Lokiarchaeota archaeon]|nr:hypothetical protein [Candidatus Lokiarchaeota archaeon]
MKVYNLTEIKTIEISPDSIIFTKKTRKWCLLPYPNHPRGCPNYNKNPLCPPFAEFLEEKVKKFNYFYLIYAVFNFREYTRKMMKRHPTWTERQARNLLYWQNSIKKMIRDHLKRILHENSNLEFYLLGCGSGFNDKSFKQEKIYSMEAAGINVFSVLKNNDISFEIKPKNRVILTTLLCTYNPLIL